MFKGMRVAVIGLGRTGYDTATILKSLGAMPFAYERKSEADPNILWAAQHLRNLSVPVYTNWSGEIDLLNIDLVVPSPGVPCDAPVLQDALAKGVPILSEIEIAYRIAKCPIIAITGTNGKSTTTTLIAQMIKANGKQAFICGNIAGVETEMTLIHAAAQARESDFLVAEISSFQLEWVEQFKPKVGVLTVIQPDHMNRYNNDFALYARTKSKLFANQDPNDFAVLNADDPNTPKYVTQCEGQKLMFTLKDSPTDTTGYFRDDVLFINWGGKEIGLLPRDEILLQGKHNIANALAASLAALALDVEVWAIRSVLRRFKGLQHRMELVGTVNGVRYINNSMCTNPEAAAASVDSLDTPIVVIAGGEDKGLDFEPYVEVLARRAKHLVLIGAHADAIEEAARAKGLKAIQRAGSMMEAVRLCSEIAEVGDTVILAPGCAAFDMFVDFKARGKQFRQGVKKLPRD